MGFFLDCSLLHYIPMLMQGLVCGVNIGSQSFVIDMVTREDCQPYKIIF